MKKIKRFAVLLIMLMLIAPVFAESTPVPGLHFFKLDNGLEVFVLENHTVPLTRIQISFRCGGLTQTPETCGIFHLYEHMLFKGNEKYKTQTEFAARMTEMGVPGFNGATSSEYVEYHIKLPSNKTDEGLEFWSYAMQNPLFDANELEKEKDVVCNEINGNRSNPSAPIFAMMTKTMFPKYPWRRDAGGYEKVIRAATRDMLIDIQKKYYIPNNAAIFVSGDVNPKKVLAAVKKYYGNWEKGPNPWAKAQDPQLRPATKKPVYLVYPDPTFYKGIAQLQTVMRGPDVIREEKPTYAADVWGYLYGSPTGKFKNNIFRTVPKIYEKDITSAGYFTQRDGGEIYFGTYILVNPKMSTAKRAKDFNEAIFAEVEKTVEDANYFDKNEFQLVKKRLEDKQILDLEESDHFMENLSFWWTASSAEYFFNYITNLNKVTKKDINEFLQEYVLSNVPIVVVRMNAGDYQKDAANFKKAGFKVITKKNCFWWGDNK